MAESFQQNGDTPPDSAVQAPPNLGGIIKWGLVILALVLVFVAANFLKSIYTDWLWFGQLGLRGVYAKIILSKIVLFVVGMIGMGIVLAVSLYFANRLSAGGELVAVPNEVRDLVKKLVVWGAVGAGLLLSVIFGAIAASEWETWLRFSNSTPFGTLDPVYNKDVSFYVFRLPFYNFLHGWLLGAAVVSLLATVGLYFVNFSLQDRGFVLTK